MLLCSSLSESLIHSTLVSGETLTPASPLMHSEIQASIPSPFSQAIFRTCLESFPSLPRKSHYGTSHFKCCMCTYGTIQNQSYVLRESPKSIETRKRTYIKLFRYNFVCSVFPNFLCPCFQHYFFVSFDFAFWPNMWFVFIDVDFHLIHYIAFTHWIAYEMKSRQLSTIWYFSYYFS